MQDETVKISIENKYGNNLNMPKNSNAVLFAELAGTKSITVHALGIIRQLGYKVEVVPAISDEMMNFLNKGK
jgi:hypothetical protein